MGLTHLGLTIGLSLVVDIAEDQSGATTAPRRQAYSAILAGPKLHLPRLGHFSSSYLVRAEQVAPKARGDANRDFSGSV
jgi:hypothetical protein